MTGSVPLVSILLPFHNESRFIEGCLASIQQQHFMDYEVIAVNDHSEDNSVEIVQRWMQKDQRIHLFHSHERGLVGALNNGIKQCRAAFIARMDADDLMLPQRLLRQYEYLSMHSHIKVVGCLVKMFPEDRIKAGYQEYMRWQNHCISSDDIANDIYVESPLIHPSVMIRAAVFQFLGGYHEGTFPEDYELWLRCHHAGYQMAKVPEILLYWRERHDRLSRHSVNYSRWAFDQLRVHFLAMDPRISLHRDLVVWGAGRVTRKRVRLLLDKGFSLKAWVDIDPNKIGQMINQVPVVSYHWLEFANKPMVLCYVTNHGAREAIKAQLEQYRYCPGIDFLMVG